ncbi:MAG: hypothetical protein METHP_01852 [Methanoregula sp. SKADARSKE-2]|nr:MAG: hypothetical protein METHP_01852 [Methanoregula sp. SKADARSKE-2]
MTKGRRPRRVIVEAKEIAGRRGDVEELVSKRTGAFDFIINEPDRVIYVKVKRYQTSFTYALEVLCKYQRELGQLHRVSLTMYCCVRKSGFGVHYSGRIEDVPVSVHLPVAWVGR